MTSTVSPRSRIRIASVGLAAALVVAGCGGGGGSPTSADIPGGPPKAVPTVQRAADGSYFAQVKDSAAAKTACDTAQRELGLQAKKLGAGGVTTDQFGQQQQDTSGVVMIALQSGQGTPAGTGATYALAPGDAAVVSKTLTLCGVALP